MGEMKGESESRRPEAKAERRNRKPEEITELKVRAEN